MNDLLLDGLATFRLQRLIRRDTITEPLRERIHWWALGPSMEPIPQDVPEEERLDRLVEYVTRPSPPGAMFVLDLLDCPWCVSVWAAGMVVALRWVPGGRHVRNLLAAAAVAGLVATHLDPETPDDR
jgi:Protein of unknown function (DUF1360)